MALFGASTDAADKNLEFATKLQLNYPLLSDPDGKVAQSYGILNRKRAKRVAIIIGKDGKVAHVVNKVELRRHGKQLLELLKELQVPLRAASPDGRDFN